VGVEPGFDQARRERLVRQVDRHLHKTVGEGVAHAGALHQVTL
jgi:hypothetical protein